MPKKDPPTKVDVITYNPTSFEKTEVTSAKGCSVYIKDKKKVTWINVDGLENAQLLEGLCRCFDLHPLVIEDILHTRQRPKIEDYDEYLYIVVRMLSLDGKNNNIKTEQVSLLLGRNYVLSFQEKKGDLFDKVREYIKKDKGKIRRMGPDFLLYALLDIVVDHHFTILEKLGEKIESMEESVVKDPSPRMLQKIRKLKRDMLILRKSVWPLRELLLNLERESTNQKPLVKKETALYLRDVYDHTIQVIDTTETFRDMVSGMVDIYLSSVSNKMNEIMKVLTIIGTIFIPITFVTGLYGMNFASMPELEHPVGYPAVLALMLLMSLVMLFYFKKKKWI